MSALYNENDKFTSQWLEGLCRAGHINGGEVDSRSIIELESGYVRGFKQFHAFAGLGLWSHALRLAGIADDSPVWTGSCPCQPFSNAGRKRGKDDKRHLWPEWRRLIYECRPPIIFGEQVASPLGRAWLDSVSTDLEALGYAVGSSDLCAAGIGAPHIRARLFFVAYAVRGGQKARSEHRARDGSQRKECGLRSGDGGKPRGMGNTNRDAAREHAGKLHPHEIQHEVRGSQGDHRSEYSGPEYSEPTGGFWAGAEWIPCRDRKWRPVEPGTFPLAYGDPTRVGRLRAYGNAIVPQIAAEFIRSAIDAINQIGESRQ